MTPLILIGCLVGSFGIGLLLGAISPSNSGRYFYVREIDENTLHIHSLLRNQTFEVKIEAKDENN